MVEILFDSEELLKIKLMIDILVIILRFLKYS